MCERLYVNKNMCEAQGVTLVCVMRLTVTSCVSTREIPCENERQIVCVLRDGLSV